jgi:RNA polymerase sigma factor (sigma-70 family)
VLIETISSTQTSSRVDQRAAGVIPINRDGGSFLAHRRLSASAYDGSSPLPPVPASDAPKANVLGFPTPSPAVTFESAILPHLDAAYNLACWITRDPSTAEDIVQDACLRALKYFKSFRGENARAWLLQIVRYAAYSITPKANQETIGRVDAENEAFVLEVASTDSGPEAKVATAQVRMQVREAVAALPSKLRECLVLREMEELSYQDIAQIVGVPIGTVMSRLFRARRMLMTSRTAVLR